MFGFGNKKEDIHRKAAREEFDKVTSNLRASDEIVQIAVGHAINMANSIFHQNFSSVDNFKQLPKTAKIAYIEKLENMENRLLQENKDQVSAIGFGLFKMWVVAVTESDNDLMQKFNRELSFFSKKGEIPL